MVIEGLEGLRIDNEAFDWQGRVHNYGDIRSIRFRAETVKHSVNIVPTGTSYKAELTLRMRSDDNVRIQHMGRALLKHDDERAGMAAVWRAREILSEMSFGGRIAPFEEAVRGRGYFTYESFQFHRDGDVFKNGQRLFGIRDEGFTVSASPFELHLKPQLKGMAKLFKGAVTIGTETDEDCLFYMLRQMYGLSWKDRPIRSKVRPLIDPRKAFLTAMVKLAAKLAGADGSVSPNELATFKDHFGISRETFPEAGFIFNKAINSNETPVEIALVAAQALSDNREFREYIVIGLVKIALADGEYHAGEHEVVEAVALALGFDTTFLDHILAMCGAFDGRAEEEGAAEPRRPPDLLAHHCMVLGVAVGSSLAEIKSAWRALAQEHHPDRLQAKGVPVSDIKAAEDVLKAINASYTWLKDFHAETAGSV